MEITLSKVKSFVVKPVPFKHIHYFVVKNHYSGRCNGCIADYSFALYDKDKMIGAAFFGRLAMANQWKRFSDRPEGVLELRRLCCIDDTPKNTESYFIGKMLRWLKQNTKTSVIVSYADEEYGHKGTIYKASNFEYWGHSKGAGVILYKGRKYHDKAIRTKYKGELKPFARELKDALENGEAVKKETAGKHTYVYRLNEPGVYDDDMLDNLNMDL
jgi:hypothetical protein